MLPNRAIRLPTDEVMRFLQLPTLCMEFATSMGFQEENFYGTMLAKVVIIYSNT